MTTLPEDNNESQEVEINYLEGRLEEFQRSQDSIVNVIEDLYARVRDLEYTLRRANIKVENTIDWGKSITNEQVNMASVAVRKYKRASIPLIQRTLKIPYTKALAVMDRLEEAGVVGPYRAGGERAINK